MSMNRKDRRRAKALARRSLDDDARKVVSTHEAGHAVAKVLAAGQLGRSISEAISYIDMGSENDLGPSTDGTIVLSSQGVTFGPMFSQEITSAATEFMEGYFAEHGVPEGSNTLVPKGGDPYEHHFKIIELARAAGADIGKWFRARTFDAVAGPMAESIISNQSFNEVFWKGDGASGDRRSVASDAKIGGIAALDAVSTLNAMAVAAAFVMERPTVWQAILSLARKLPVIGRMDGSKAVDIIASIISEPELSGLFTEALEAIPRFERDISCAEIVVGTYPDGTNHVIKGADKIHSNDLQVVQYHCSSALEETLWNAFGDGAGRSTEVL